MKINKIITRFIIFNICISLFILFTADHIIPFHNIETYSYENNQIIVLLIISWFIALVLFFFSDITAAGLWNKGYYSPECYYFTNGDKAIVVEEESYILYGGAIIYQVLNNNEALIIGHISTDDGYRNKGNYDIKWNEDNLEISYHYGDLENKILTEKIEYAE